jgi:hypothetical protein
MSLARCSCGSAALRPSPRKWGTIIRSKCPFRDRGHRPLSRSPVSGSVSGLFLESVWSGVFSGACGPPRHPTAARIFQASLNKGNSMVAIPVLRSRVAPVLNWCSTIHIFPDDTGETVQGREIILLSVSGTERLRILKQEGVRTIICGALSQDLLSFGKGLGLHIIHGVAGEVGDVLQAYRARNLDLPCYWLPGCRGPRHYRRARSQSCLQGADDKVGQSVSKGAGSANEGSGARTGSRKGRTEGVGSGPGGFCVCPRCGAKADHRQGIPCTQVVCSRCDQPMVRG